MFHLVSYNGFRRTQYIPESGIFFNKLGRFWRVSDFEELSGGYSQEMMGMVHLVMLSPACHVVEDQLVG